MAKASGTKINWSTFTMVALVVAVIVVLIGVAVISGYDFAATKAAVETCNLSGQIAVEAVDGGYVCVEGVRRG